MASLRKPQRVPDSTELAGYLTAFLQQHISPASGITLGLSGGLDSCVLFDLLIQARSQLGFHFSAIHINHQISAHADAWAMFCAELCAKHDVPLHNIKVDVPRNSGKGLEAAAREVRYQALLEYAEDALLLAHHLDDQAETLLLQLLRGAGVDGLAAMPIQGLRASKPVFRPFLMLSRRILETYAKARHLQWIDDESNQDCRYDRNFLRHDVFPVVETRFPAYRATLARAAENLADVTNLLMQVAEEDATAALQDGKLDLTLMKGFSLERAMNLLRWWIQAETGMNPSRAWLHNSLEQLFHAQANAQVECQLGDVVLRRYRNWAYVDCKQVTAPYCMDWDGQDDLLLPDGSKLVLHVVSHGGIPLDIVSQGLQVTNRGGVHTGWKMELRPDKNRPTRSLKNLWQEAGVPPRERDCTPLIWSRKILLAVPGVGVSADAWQEYGRYAIAWER